MALRSAVETATHRNTRAHALTVEKRRQVTTKNIPSQCFCRNIVRVVVNLRQENGNILGVMFIILLNIEKVAQFFKKRTGDVVNLRLRIGKKFSSTLS